ncbi:Spermatid-associated protein [Varanus komodoensis]|uniref:protein chibby homolog 2 n=1 Tax=Varanus komodoensis TaxID=61221 RepID=UPI001CF769A3|nr:protein chibby homolog 2 [Varanus komodoensis]KAF7247352.1 Spermatid-associated protein [Varanus komodoensis]
MDYIPPKVKLSDDTFIFLDGKWVNESYIQSAFPSSAESHKKHSNKVYNDWSLWEENKALWEENKALRVENRALREENKALQCLRMENKGIQVIYDESLQQVLQHQKKPLVALPVMGGLQDGIENKLHPVIQEESKALQLLRENNVVLKVFPEEKKPPAAPQKEKPSTQLLAKEDVPSQDTSQTIVQETQNRPALTEAAQAAQESQEEVGAVQVHGKSKTSLLPLDDNEALDALQKVNQTVLFLLREKRVAMEQKLDLLTIQGGNKMLQEENNKLKFQQNAIKGAISKIIAQMGVLQEELNSFTST